MLRLQRAFLWIFSLVVGTVITELAVIAFNRFREQRRGAPMYREHASLSARIKILRLKNLYRHISASM